MAELCDNKSVGMIITDGDRLLMIDRGNYPRCKALPAGHLDGGSYPEMAITEVSQEVGLEVPMRDLLLAFGEMQSVDGIAIGNPCKREGGSNHKWRVYRLAGPPPTLELKAGDDAKQAFWATRDEWQHYAIRTEYFFSKLGLSWTEVGALTLAVFGDPKTGPVTDEEKIFYAEWESDPGLEPVWYYVLRMANFFDWTFQNAPVKKVAAPVPADEVPDGN